LVLKAVLLLLFMLVLLLLMLLMLLMLRMLLMLLILLMLMMLLIPALASTGYSPDVCVVQRDVKPRRIFLCIRSINKHPAKSCAASTDDTLGLCSARLAASVFKSRLFCYSSLPTCKSF
jgi:hypothetical protein